MLKKIEVSSNPRKNWMNDDIQFPRLIMELEAAEVFTPKVLAELENSMDLNSDEIMEIVDRAQETWDSILVRTRKSKR